MHLLCMYAFFNLLKIEQQIYGTNIDPIAELVVIEEWIVYESTRYQDRVPGVGNHIAESEYTPENDKNADHHRSTPG